MTVAELIDLLEDMEPDMEVAILHPADKIEPPTRTRWCIQCHIVGEMTLEQEHEGQDHEFAPCMQRRVTTHSDIEDVGENQGIVAIYADNWSGYKR